MTLTKGLIPISALTLALSLSGSVSQAAQREDRNSGQTQGHARQRSGGDQRGSAPEQRQNNNQARRDNNEARRDNGAVRRDNRDNNEVRRNDGRFDGRRDERFDRRDEGRSFRGYATPLPRYNYRDYGRPSYNHHYGPGFSVFFGIGSGYRYGAPYYGRVYGYIPSPVYGARIYYGDVRLQVRPRDASVFVDGYYAGIVDDFDGIFQRLTLTVGPHEIEIEAPGLEPQVFNVMVDPARTIDVRADLYPAPPYQP